MCQSFKQNIYIIDVISIIFIVTLVCVVLIIKLTIILTFLSLEISKHTLGFRKRSHNSDQV